MARALLNQNHACFVAENKFDFPPLVAYTEPINCDSWVGIDKATQDTTHSGLHFFEDDYKIERLWNNPLKYINLLSKFDYVIQTDFSLYYNFPVALQIYNKFRNHWLANFYLLHGIVMIPNIRASLPELWDWSFDGYPENSVVAFSDIGVSRDRKDKEINLKSYDEMLRRLSPVQVLYFTRSPTNAPSECTVIPLSYLKGGD